MNNPLLLCRAHQHRAGDKRARLKSAGIDPVSDELP
jgi:hypothetical protein